MKRLEMDPFELRAAERALSPRRRAEAYVLTAPKGIAIEHTDARTPLRRLIDWLLSLGSR